MEERKQKLIELRGLVESGSENWTLLNAAELYFFGQIMSTCKCKTSAVRSKLNQYWEQHKHELDEN